MTDQPLLPAGFEDLQRFLPRWAGETPQERWDARAAAPMDDIRAFYDAMIERAEAALEHLKSFSLTAMPAPESRLFRLLLSLAQAAMAVELHGQPRAPFSPYPHKIRVARGPLPFA